MKTNIYFIALLFLIGIALFPACKKDTSVNPIPLIKIEDTAVVIEDMGKYYMVTIDMTKGYSHYQVGQSYGRCIKKMVPGYEDIISSYLWQLATVQGLWLNTIPSRIENVKPQIDAAYVDEMNGLVSQMAGTSDWTGHQLIYGFNLIPDIFRSSQCSAFGCWGAASFTGKNVAYRTLDWWGGLWKVKIPTIQAVTKIKYPTQTIYLIGALGSLGCITGINYNTGVMGAILDSDVGSDYHSPGMRSYNFDLRHALETSNTKEQVAGYLKDPLKPYAFNHLIFLADDKNCVMLENNISNSGSNPQRALRYDTSYLNPGINWNFKEMIGGVNCFMLRGQVDNYSAGPNEKINTQRWKLMLQRTVDKLYNSPQHKLTSDGVREIMSSYWGSKPESLIGGYGDLYNTDTQQMMVYIPVDRSLRVFFKPKDNSTPLDPGAYFITIPLSQ